MLKKIDIFWLSFADKVMLATNNFVSLIVKIMLSGFLLKLSLTIIAKTHCFVHLSLIQLCNDSMEFQVMSRYCLDMFMVQQLLYLPKSHSQLLCFLLILNLYLKDLPLFKMGFFWAADKWGGAKRSSPIPKICHKYRTMIKLELYLT